MVASLGHNPRALAVRVVLLPPEAARMWWYLDVLEADNQIPMLSTIPLSHYLWHANQEMSSPQAHA